MPMVDYTEIRSSAPGRFILMGEFADMFEKNAIGMTIDCHCRVIIRPYSGGKVRLNLKNYNNIREWPTTAFTMVKFVAKYADTLNYNKSMPARLIHLLHKRYFNTPPEPSATSNDKFDQRVDILKQADDATMVFLILYLAIGDSFAWSARPPLDIEVESDIPIGKGLGSSTALIVALCGALMKVFRVSAESYVTNNWAFGLDKFFNPQATGLSTNCIIHGGHTYVQNNRVKGTGVEYISPIRVMFVETGLLRNPKTVYDAIASQMKEEDQRLDEVFSSINEQASLAHRRLNDPHFAPRSIAPFLTMNQELLDAIGATYHDKIVDICNKASRSGLAAKQNNCGELVFVLYDEQDACEQMAEFRHLMMHGYNIRDYKIVHKGLQVESISQVAIIEYSESNTTRANMSSQSNGSASMNVNLDPDQIRSFSTRRNEQIVRFLGGGSTSKEATSYS